MRLKIPRDSRTGRRRVRIPIEQPLLIRLTQDVGKLPARFTYEIPRAEAMRLIEHRKATAVGAYRTATPDLVLSEEDWGAVTS